MKLSFALPAALAALALVPATGVAQSELYPRWEIPGFDFRHDGAWRVRARQVSALRRRDPVVTGDRRDLERIAQALGQHLNVIDI